jgi:hypothetical protein
VDDPDAAMLGTEAESNVRAPQPTGLPERPPISTPRWMRSAAHHERARAIRAAQPMLGLAGVPAVLVVASALLFALGGPEPSLRVLAPISTFALPLIAMVAFWWEDWPGDRFHGGPQLLTDLAVVAVCSVLLTVLGQLVVGHFNTAGLFSASPHAGSATFPATMPLAATVFICMLQLTLVNEGWPLRRLPRQLAGGAALLAAASVGLVVYVLLIKVQPPSGSGLRTRAGALAGPELAGLLVAVGVWQVLFFVVLEGWPFAHVKKRPARLLLANATVLGGGISTYLLATEVGGLAPTVVAAVGGCAIAAGLVVGLLFEGWSPLPRRRGWGPAFVVATCAAMTWPLYAALDAIARGVSWRPPATPAAWVAYATLNALGIGVILHVAIGRRWPLAGPTDTTTAE